jgi:membrane-bound ClpP family serine protease
MLFNAPDPAMRLSMNVIIPSILAVGGFFLIASWLSIKAMFRKPVIGHESLTGQIGEARSDINEKEGIAFVAGTHWNAVSSSPTPIPKGTPIRVTAVLGMKLIVEAINNKQQTN